jgi:uncharacterized membrane protein YdjX (TVP38/TMEM64 family)
MTGKTDTSRRKVTEQNQTEPSGQSKWTWLVPVVLIASLIGLYFLWPGFQSFADHAYATLTSGDRERITNWVQTFGFWGPLLILTLMVAQTLLAFIPSVLIMVVSVLAYGPLWGGLLSWGGLLMAALVAYGIGRALGPATVDRLIGQETEQKLERFVARYGVWGVIAARVSPALSTDAVSYVAGLVGMGSLRFLFATAVGILPLAVLISFLGADIDRLRNGLIWVSVISLGLFVGYVLYDRRKRRA